MRTMVMSPGAFDEFCEVLLSATLEMSKMQRMPTDGEGLALLTMRALVGLGAISFDEVVKVCTHKLATSDAMAVEEMQTNLRALFGNPEVLQRVGITFQTLH